MFMISRIPVRIAHSTPAATNCRVRRAHRIPGSGRAHRSPKQSGFTLIEMLIATAIASLLIAGLGGIIGQSLAIQETVSDSNQLNRQARFAMQRMQQAVSNSRLLLLPLNDKPASNWLENVREETVPPTTPTDDSTKYTAVLAVTLPLYSDLDADGFPDADNDRDGRIDEDLPGDIHYDIADGIWLIDDDGDGSVDESFFDNDDDEVLSVADEDPMDGIDDDGDNNIDEDPGSDNNGDGCDGICGVDDDGDGAVDEGSAFDDDEDGASDEDWYDPVVFYLAGSTLMERTPVPWDESGVGGISGRDFITSSIADNVTRFRVERLPLDGGRYVLLDLTLELRNPDSGETASLSTRLRVGGAL